MELRRVSLFRGHRIDAADCAKARFPAAKEGIAAKSIAARLEQRGSKRRRPGDLLFAEAALHRGYRLQLHRQCSEDNFLETSVAFAIQSWVDRYRTVKANALIRVCLQPLFTRVSTHP